MWKSKNKVTQFQLQVNARRCLSVSPSLSVNLVWQ